MDKRIIALLLPSILLLCMCLGGEKGNDAPDAPDRAAHYKETAVTQEKVSMPSTTQPGKGAASTPGLTSTTISSTKGCSICSDGTVCGQYHVDGQKVVACICEIPWGDGNYGSCYLSRGRICSSCTDGTPCGGKNANGELCKCWEKLDGGGYLSCYLPIAR